MILLKKNIKLFKKIIFIIYYKYLTKMVFDRNEYNKKFREENREYFKEYVKQYRQTEKGKKVNTLHNWKVRGVVHPDLNELYNKYINTEFCELCEVQLTQDRHNTKTTRCLDHDHETGLFRNVVCHTCNVKRR